MRFTVIIAVLIPLILSAQIDSLWSRTYGGAEEDICFSLRQTADGGYVLGGNTRSYTHGSNLFSDFWLVKIDENGDSLWSRNYGGSNTEYLSSLLLTADGGYLLIGHTRSYGAGVHDFWILKTNANGDSLWSRTYGGSGMDFCTSAQQLADGSYIFSGETYSFGAGWVDIWLIKADTNGDSIWSRTYGGSYNEKCKFVTQTGDGGYILIGETSTYGSGQNDFWLLKVNASGDSLWSHTYGGTYFDYCESVIQTNDNGFVLAGYTQSFGSGFSDFYLVKTNANGDTLWTRTYGTASQEKCFAVQQTSDGGYILGGSTDILDPDSTDFWIVKTDTDGDSLWSRIYGGIGFDNCRSICQITDTDYFLSGYTNSFGAGDYDYWLVKIGYEPELSPDSLSVPFEQIVIGEENTGIVDLAVGDIDADGDMDIAAVDMFADKVVAFDNLNDGAFFERLIDDSLDGAAAVDVGLLYSSTILDIVAAGRFDDDVRVYRHFGEWSFMPYVLGGEGNNKNDIIIAEDNSFSIFSSSVEGNVTYWEADLIEEYTWMPYTISHNECNVDHLITAYINGDRMDILGSSRESGKVYWWDADSDGGYTEHEILSGIHLNVFDIADMDNDGDQDLLCATTSGDLLWYENIRGEEHTEHTITAGMQYPFDIQAADINMDGFMDFVIADTYADEISWWRNTGGGHFRRNIIANDFTQARALEVIDFDGDGDVDIVGAGQNGIVLWRNDLIIPEEEPPSVAKLSNPIIPNDDILAESPGVGNDLPKEFALYANHPNPFNATTTISFSLPLRTEVSLTVHDVLGRTTETLVDGSIEAGSHSLNWSCPDCATGVYFIVMQTAEFRAIQKALLIK